MRARILVDLDGVLARWAERTSAGFNAHPLVKENGWELDFAALPSFDCRSHVKALHGLAAAHVLEEVLAADGFYADLGVAAGAVDAVRRMRERFEVSICTAPMLANRTCASDKFTWVARHFGDALARRVIITKDKTLVRGDVLIDDKPDITGEETSDWTQVLFDQPWNQAVELPRILAWDDWESVVVPLLEARQAA